MSAGSRPGKIAVGVDGSPSAAVALAWAVEEARLRGLTLQVIYAFPALVSPLTGTTAPEYYPQIENEAQEVLSRAIAQLTEPDVHIDRTLVPGNPAAVLIEASRAASLLVVGSRGIGGFRGMLLGSVSSHLVHHAHCPVVVVRDGSNTRQLWLARPTGVTARWWQADSPLKPGTRATPQKPQAPRSRPLSAPSGAASRCAPPSSRSPG